MKLAAVLTASILSVAAFAQSATVETESATAGLLGKRFVGVGFGWLDVNHSSVEAMSTGLEFNLPVHTNIDLGLGYGYTWLEGAEEIGHTLGASVTGYFTRAENKPYARLSIGQFWGNDDWYYDADYAIWGAEVGVERAVTDKLSLTFSVSYNDDFENGDNGSWSTALGGTYNLTDALVATADVSWLEYGSVGYTAGLAFRF